jgi:hypothetical protein
MQAAYSSHFVLVEELRETNRRAMQSIWLVGCEMRVPHYRQYDISNYSSFGQHLFLMLYGVVPNNLNALF